MTSLVPGLSLRGFVLLALSVAGLLSLTLETGATLTDRQPVPRGRLSGEEAQLVRLFEKSAPSVVNVRTSKKVQGLFSRDVFQVPSGTGTGFIWDLDGHIVTNYHVVANASGGISIVFSDGTSTKATVVGYSRAKDLAVLRIEDIPEGTDLIPLGTSDDLKVGQSIHAIGNPFGLDQSLSRGVISALGREIQSLQGTTIHDVIQTDAAVNPGNSGGPLLDSSGRLIGVNTAIYSPTGASAGISFSIPVDTVLRIVPDLIEHGEVRRPVLGFVPYNGSNASRFKGVVVVSVDGPLQDLGVQGVEEGEVRDMIVAIDGRETPSLGELLSILEDYRPGMEVEVVFECDSTRRSLRTVLQAPPS